MLVEGFHVDMSFLRLVRLARIFRILKMARYSETSHLVTFTLRKVTTHCLTHTHFYIQHTHIYIYVCTIV